MISKVVANDAIPGQVLLRNLASHTKDVALAAWNNVSLLPAESQRAAVGVALESSHPEVKVAALKFIAGHRSFAPVLTSTRLTTFLEDAAASVRREGWDYLDRFWEKRFCGVVTRSRVETALTVPVVMESCRPFHTVFFGQLISSLGSQLSEFVLGITLYLLTGSATVLTFLLLAMTVPSIVAGFIAGPIADRWDRRKIMLVCDAVGCVSALAVLLLVLLRRFDLALILPVVALSSLARCFHTPAFQASTALLAPKNYQIQAAQLQTFRQLASLALPPLMASFLLSHIPLWSFFMLDALSFVVAIATLFVTPVPSPMRAGNSVLKEMLTGFAYISHRAPLRALFLVYAATTAMLGFVQVLANPLALSFTTPQMMGVMIFVGTVGLLIATAAMMRGWIPAKYPAWVPKQLSFSMLAALSLGGVGIAVAGLRPNVPLTTSGIFLFWFAYAIYQGFSRGLIQMKVDPGVQGRVFSFLLIVVSASIALGNLLAGPLADKVFTPLFSSNGLIAHTFLRSISGIGPGRGIAFFHVLLGGIMMLLGLIGYRYRPLREIEQVLPNQIPDPAHQRAEDEELQIAVWNCLGNHWRGLDQKQRDHLLQPAQLLSSLHSSGQPVSEACSLFLNANLGSIPAALRSAAEQDLSHAGAIMLANLASSNGTGD